MTDGTEAPSLAPLLRDLFARWKTIGGAVVAAALIAIALSFVLPKAYSSAATFTPEEQKNANLPAGLGGLAGQFGLVMGGGSQSPEFYSRLLASRYIREQVVQARFSTGTLIDYYDTGGRADSVDRAIRKFTKNYSVSVDRLSNSVRIEVEVRSPELAREVTQALLDEVDRFNGTMRRTMARERREFVDQRLKEAGNGLADAEGAMQGFLTRNRAGDSPQLQFERSRLDRKIQLAQDLYLNLERQAQTARIDEVNDTPVISVIDPPFLPVRPSRPNRLLLVMLAMFFGGVLASGYVVAQGVRGRRD
jgi:uncharacterized protein involved in exopolysaccharide biosynthesis